MVFPNDANGELLELMQGEGIDLSQSYMLDFYVVFKSEAAAQKAIEPVQAQFSGAGLFLNLNEESEQWELRLQEEMIPSYAAICDIETKLANICKPLKGKPDGWGMLEPEDEE